VAFPKRAENDDAIWIGEGQRLQKNGVHNAEHGGVRADSEGHDYYRHGGEAGIFWEHPEGESQILEQRFKKREPAPVAVILLCLFDAAEFDERLAARLRLGHSSAQAFFNVQLKMTFHLGGEIGIELPLAKESADSPPQCAKPPHDCSSSGVRKRARMAVVCSHSRASLSSCFRPARVSL
jgi:hypothetical protein